MVQLKFGLSARSRTHAGEGIKHFSNPAQAFNGQEEFISALLEGCSRATFTGCWVPSS